MTSDIRSRKSSVIMSRATKKRRRDKHDKTDNKNFQISANSNNLISYDSYQNQSLKHILNEEDLNCIQQSSDLFSCILYPLQRHLFYEDYWKKKPSAQIRNNPLAFSGFYSYKLVENITSKRVLQCPQDIILGKFYNNNQYYFQSEEELSESNSSFVISESQIMMALSDGYSMRIMSPQKFSDKIWKFLSLLEIEFNDILECHIGISQSTQQGFRIMSGEGEQFFLLLEGKLRWIVYDCANCKEFVNRNLACDKYGTIISLDDLAPFLATPVLDTVLSAGDTLYIPKNCVYMIQDCTCGERASYMSIATHFTGNMKHFLNMVLPNALELVNVNDKPLQQIDLPTDLLSFMGVARSEEDDERRGRFDDLIQSTMKYLTHQIRELSDAAVDQVSK